MNKVNIVSEQYCKEYSDYYGISGVIEVVTIVTIVTVVTVMTTMMTVSTCSPLFFTSRGLGIHILYNSLQLYLIIDFLD